MSAPLRPGGTITLPSFRRYDAILPDIALGARGVTRTSALVRPAIPRAPRRRAPLHRTARHDIPVPRRASRRRPFESDIFGTCNPTPDRVEHATIQHGIAGRRP